jgi:hypothetical protein
LFKRHASPFKQYLVSVTNKAAAKSWLFQNPGNNRIPVSLMDGLVFERRQTAIRGESTTLMIAKGYNYVTKIKSFSGFFG